MYPKILDPSFNMLAVLDTIVDDTAAIYEKINTDYTFNFEMYAHELKSEYIVVDNIAEADNQYFDIKYISVNHDIEDKVLYEVEAEHVSYRLLDEELTFYSLLGTPTEILTDLLIGTDFTVGTIEFTEEQLFAVNEETTKLRVIQQLAASVNAEIQFTNKGFEINFKNDIGQNNGFEIRVGKNLKQIEKVIDKRGQLKVYYKIDMIELKNTDYYKQSGFDVLEVVEKGDTIKVKDPMIGVDIEIKVLSKHWNPIKEISTEIELVNNIELASDEMVSIETNSFNKNELLYGIKVNNEIGFQVERNDKLARSIFNADTFKMQKGNGLGSYTDSIYFDPIEQRYVFKGEIVVEEISGLDADDVDETVDKIWADDSWRVSGKTTIQGGSIETDSILADSINVNQLSAISADLGTITAGAINGGTIDISTNASVGDKFTLGEVFGNRVDLERSSGDFYIGRNGNRQMKFFANGTVVNDRLFMVSGQKISVLNSFEGLGFLDVIGLQNYRIDLGRPGGGTTNVNTYFWDDAYYNNNDVYDIDAIYAYTFNPRNKTFVSDPAAINVSGSADSTYSSNEQNMINALKQDVINLRSTLFNLTTALSNYGLI